MTATTLDLTAPLPRSATQGLALLAQEVREHSPCPPRRPGTGQDGPASLSEAVVRLRLEAADAERASEPAAALAVEPARAPVPTQRSAAC